MKKLLLGLLLFYKVDGIAQVFTLVKDINPGGATSAPDELAVFNSKLYFRANNGINGNELHVTDGTDAGTMMVKDIRPGALGGSVALLSVINNKLSFFSNDGGGLGTELWASDGSESGTVFIKDINTGSASSVGAFYANLSGFKYFDGTVNDISGPVTEFWRTDGTDAGTTLVKAINASGSSGSSPRNLITIGNQVFFYAYDDVSGYELWKSDGTNAGTTLTKDINPGNIPSSPEGNEIRGFNNVAYFKKSNGVNGVELWRSDGTEAGTIMVKDINPGAGDSNPFNFIVFNNFLYFIATDGISNKLWKTDGTEAGTISLAAAGGTFSTSGLISMAVLQNYLLFPGTDATNGTELWKTDGTPGGTAIIKDINPGTASSNLANFINTGDKIIFQATTAANGAEPWSSDGTYAGTNLIQDIQPGTGSSTIQNFTIIGSKLFALATTTLYGREVWVANNFVTLPLQFLSFTAQKCNSNQVCLTWKTANEQNVSHFEIERSTDGTRFTTIGIKSANNQSQNTYTTTDDIAALQNSKKIYYRIREVDNDGRSKQSNINLVQLDSKGVLVYPTLVSSSFIVQNNSAATLQLQLTGIDGKVVLQQTISQGTNTVSSEKLPGGVYLYRIVDTDKTIKTNGKIIKQ
jgi:ELWxxDGT repeat protein